VSCELAAVSTCAPLHDQPVEHSGVELYGEFCVCVLVFICVWSRGRGSSSATSQLAECDAGK
jgi:hypothetical protein